MLWTEEPFRLNVRPPTHLFTSLPGDLLFPWLEKNPWAKSLPVIVWTDAEHWEAVRAWAFLTNGKFFTFQEPGDGPHAIGHSFGQPFTCYRSNRIDSVVESARRVTYQIQRQSPDAVVWDVGAEHHGGVLAIGAALLGSAVAVPTVVAQPGPLTLACANKHGVDLRVIRDSDVIARMQDA